MASNRNISPSSVRDVLKQRASLPDSWKKAAGITKKSAQASLRQIAIDRGYVYTYQIVLRPESEGGYTVFVPSLPGCITYGRTLKEVHTMAEDAIRAYLLSREKHEESEPVSDKQSLISLVDVPFYR